MNKFLKNVIVFILFAVLFYVVALLLAGALLPKRYNKNLQYCDNAGWLYTRLQDLKQTPENIDILVLGSSRTYRGYDPRIFKKYGLSVFTLGSNNQTPVQTEMFARRYLAKIKPKMVIIDVYPLLLEMDGIESALNVVTNDDPDIHAWRMAKNLNHIKVYNSMTFAFLSRMFHMRLPEIATHDTSKFDYVKGGFVACKVLQEKASQSWEPRKVVFTKMQMNAFHNLIKTVKDIEVPYYIIQSPLNGKLYSMFANEKEIDSFFSSYGNYYNFNKLYPEYKAERFHADEYHLNQPGVEVFNNALIPMLLRDNKEIFTVQ